MFTPVCLSESLTLCFRDNLVEREDMRTVQSHELCAAELDPNDTDEVDESLDIQRDLERHERPKVLTSEQTVIINLSDCGGPQRSEEMGKSP